MEYLANEGFAKAKKEKRKTVYYKDLGKCPRGFVCI
jgi:histone H3/H4